VTKKGDKSNDIILLEESVYLAQYRYVDRKGVGMKDQMTAYLEMSLQGM